MKLAKWFPSESDLEWCRGMLRSFPQGQLWSTWCGELYLIDHEAKQLKHIGGPSGELHQRNVVAFGLIGYEVVDCLLTK